MARRRKSRRHRASRRAGAKRLSLTPNGNVRYAVNGFTSVAGAEIRRSDLVEDAVPKRHHASCLTSGVLPTALRVCLRLFKIVPDDFVEPLEFIARLAALVPKPRNNITQSNRHLYAEKQGPEIHRRGARSASEYVGCLPSSGAFGRKVLAMDVRNASSPVSLTTLTRRPPIAFAFLLLLAGASGSLGIRHPHSTAADNVAPERRCHPHYWWIPSGPLSLQRNPCHRLLQSAMFPCRTLARRPGLCRSQA